MATATAKKTKAKKGKDNKTNLKNTLNELNGVLIDTSEELIENAVKTGEKYQKLFAKSIKKSEPMIEKNVDIFFDTVEGILDQAEAGTVRFKKLIGWNEKLVSKWKKRAEKNITDLRKDVEETIETVQSEIIERIPGMEQPVKKATTTATKAKKATKKATATAKKAATRTTKKATVTAKKAVKRPATRVRAKKGLQVINGIGPKAEKILIAAGFTTVEKIAKASASKIEVAIEKSGAPIKVNAKSWITQAKKINK